MFGFGIITVPLLIILVYNNWYAMNIVRNQVAASNRNIVQMHSNQVDNVLAGMEKYLYSMAFQDPNIVYINPNPINSIEDYHAYLNLVSKFQKDIFEHKDANAIFLYKPLAREFITAAQRQEDAEKINSKLGSLLEDPEACKKLTKKWQLFSMDGKYFLLKLTDTGFDTYLGVWVNLDDLLRPIRFLQFSENTQVMFTSSEGVVLTTSTSVHSLKMFDAEGLKKALAEKEVPYSVLKSWNDGEDSIIVSVHSNVSDLYLVVVLPENILLEKLTIFQSIIYVTPIAAVIFLAVYLIYLQRSIESPIRKLLQGMKKIQSGDLTARLAPTNLLEFNMINDAFNDMAHQIDNLKSDIYEEQIRVQKAEMKELQAQIYPHFFANCLNLIYSLAQVKNTELVQQLALHLVKHLRFIIRTNRTLVTISDELEHIDNYLSIQKIRFPQSFEYSIESDELLWAVSIPAFIVLPFVENAMEHGFCYREGIPFSVSVKVRLQSEGSEKYISIKIEDNGKGFAQEILTELQSGNYSWDDSDKHIGIWNVRRRCQLYYHKEVKIQFYNGHQGGAVVEMVLPVNDLLSGGI